MNPIKVNEIHQMDFVGPRYIKAYGAISSLNMIDVVSNKISLQQYASRSMKYILEFLRNCWTKNAIPKYLQMDNGAYFIGNMKHKRHFSKVVRLCLYFGVETVFISPRCHWMNGSIENFNGQFGEKLWEREEFKDLEHIRRESKIFKIRHNKSQDWKNRKEILTSIPIRKIPENFEIEINKLPITKGKVHFIRKVKKSGRVSVLNEDFDIDESLAYEYVWVTIDTKKEQLMIYHREKNADEARLVKAYKYKIDTVVELFELEF